MFQASSPRLHARQLINGISNDGFDEMIVCATFTINV